MAKRRGLTCVLFNEVPDGTHYRKGAYSWVSDATAEAYIVEGYCVEYDPYNGRIEEVPTMDSLKDEITRYLEERGIDYGPGDTKAELLERI